MPRPPKNFHKSSLASLYQTSVQAQQQQQRSATSYNQHNHHQQQQVAGGSGMLRDIDLAKLGLLNPHDALPNLQAPPPQQQSHQHSLPQQHQQQSASTTTTANTNPANREELVKAIQAIYGKTSTDILQKALGDWPQQPISPPDCYPNSRQSASGGGGGPNAMGNFNNNVNSMNHTTSTTSTNYPGQSSSRQDTQFSSSNSNHLNHHQQASSNMNHYRASLPHLQQQHPSNRKSVLSLHHHQQQQQHNQNDLSGNRRLKQHHHQMNTTNASFANHNTAASAACIATSTSAQLSDTINSSTLGGVGVACSSTAPSIAGGSNGTMSGQAATAANVPILLDPINSIDNMFYDNSMQIDSDISPSNQQQQQQQRSLRKHQQLQKLLKASSHYQITNTSPSPSATLPLAQQRTETQFQRSVSSANNMSQTPNMSMSSTSTSTIQSSHSQPAGYSSVPKSLLNLAACTSNAPSSSGNSSMAPAKFSSMVSQFKSARNNNSNNNHQTNLNISNNSIDNAGTAANRIPASRDGFINIDTLAIPGEALEGIEHSGSLSQHIRSTSNNIVSTSRPNSKQQQWSTLLSDEQTSSSLNRTNSKILATSHTSPGNKVDQSHLSKPNASSTEAFLAKLQERAARAGVSIGEISRSNQSSASLLNVSGPTCCSPQPNQLDANVASISPDQQKDDYLDYYDLRDKKTLSNALGKVGTKNDLSLLYSPMQLASNSQKQINVLSAGLETNEESELFTKEVKRIIHEECNIIYECKECRNLFRSLANLVKHKRTYCTENKSRDSVEAGKRSGATSILPNIDQEQLADLHDIDSADPRRIEHEQLALADLRRINEGVNLSARKLDRRQNAVSGDPRAMRGTARNQEKRNTIEHDEMRLQTQTQTRLNQPQSSLSKILQSQPKGRIPVSRDNALLGALSITSSANLIALNSAIDDDSKSINSDQVDEHLVRNSSLAQTLLNEKLARGETAEPRAVKRPAPKRKLLEDCIQKVKRDKLLNEDEEPSQQQQQSQHSPVKKTNTMQSKDEQTNENFGDDSEADSDMLTIDLDCDTRNKIVNRRASNAGNCSSNSSPSSVVKLASSSALLKALTRPVDSKRPYTSNPIQNSLDEPKLSADQPNPETGSAKPSSENNEDQAEVPEPESSPVSPLFDRYTCDVCESDHDDLKALMNHTMEKHVEMKMVYPCIFCSLSFMALENVCRHILDFHKKAKAHVHRLKDVVRSRSHLSADFLTCSDYPPRISDSEPKKDPIETPASSDQTASSETSDHSQELQQPQTKAGSKSEGMVTRGKKRVDYNSMLNSRDPAESGSYTTRARKTRSQSADQPISDETSTKEIHEKAASVDGGSLALDEKADDGISSKHEEIDVCSATPKDQDGEDCDEPMSHYENDDSDNEVDCERLEVDDDQSSDQEQNMDEEGDCNDNDADDKPHDDNGIQREKLPLDDNESNDAYLDDDESNNGAQDDQSESSSEHELDIDDDNMPEAENGQQQSVPQVDDDADISDFEDLDDEDDQNESGDEPDFSHRPPEDHDSSSGSSSDHDSDLSDEDSDGRNPEDQLGEDEEGDSRPTQSETADGSNVSPENAKQVTSSTTSLNKSSASESTPSSSGGSASGGIMKLKIQLKTRPDEKSKVYEIV